MESTDTKKVSAAPVSLEGHDSDNNSDNNSSEHINNCLNCDFPESECF